MKELQQMTQKIRTYIHIGSHKTGTTAIQQYLLMNRDQLISEGLYFPDQLMGIKHPSHYLLNVVALNKNWFSSMKENLLAKNKPEFFKHLRENLKTSIARHYQKQLNSVAEKSYGQMRGCFY